MTEETNWFFWSRERNASYESSLQKSHNVRTSVLHYVLVEYSIAVPSAPPGVGAGGRGWAAAILAVALCSSEWIRMLQARGNGINQSLAFIQKHCPDVVKRGWWDVQDQKMVTGLLCVIRKGGSEMCAGTRRREEVGLARLVPWREEGRGPLRGRGEVFGESVGVCGVNSLPLLPPRLTVPP